MRCPICGHYYLPSDTVCPQCGAALTPTADETLSNRPGTQHHYLLSSGGYLWEYRDLHVSLDLTFVTPAVSADRHQQFISNFDRMIRSALEAAAAEGWETDEPVTWEDLRETGKIELSWWDQLKDILGIGVQRSWRTAIVRVRRVAQEQQPIAA